MTPTSLTLYGMAHALFYGTLTYEELEEDYFTSAYGKEQKISDFLKKMSAVLPRDYMLCRTDILTEEDWYRLKEGLVWVQQFKKAVFLYLPEEAVHRRNCRYFKEYLDILEFIVQVMADKAEGCSEEKVEAYIEEYRHLLYRKEAVMPGYMSAARWFGHIRNGFRNKNELKEF